MKQQKAPDSISSGFDEWAESYEEHLNSCLDLSGEKSDFFHLQKLACLKRWIPGIERNSSILDYGCGIGKLASLVAQAFPQSTVTGYDISLKCLEIARNRWGHLQNLLFTDEFRSKKDFDLIIAANVFHHIKAPHRAEKLLQLREMIKPGRNIVIFEHNPRNPVTRHIVRTCPFDREAELISLSQFIGLAHKSELRMRLKRYIVFFPRILSPLRRLEPFLGFLPLGAQYMLLLGLEEQDE